MKRKKGTHLGIDINRLAPWAQAQIAQKAAAQIREKAQREEEKKRKYNNTPTERIAEDSKTIKFDSQKEARRFDELMLMLKAGQIHELKLQPQFTLQEAYTTIEGKRVRAIRYQADFSYKVRDPHAEEEAEMLGFPCESWRTVVEDVKSKASKTRVYAMKFKLLVVRFGISISVIELWRI